jgi:hypothetical protein
LNFLKGALSQSDVYLGIKYQIWYLLFFGRLSYLDYTALFPPSQPADPVIVQFQIKTIDTINSHPRAVGINCYFFPKPVLWTFLKTQSSLDDLNKLRGNSRFSHIKIYPYIQDNNSDVNYNNVCFWEEQNMPHSSRDMPSLKGNLLFDPCFCNLPLRKFAICKGQLSPAYYLTKSR